MIIVYGKKNSIKTVKYLGKKTCPNCGHEIEASLVKEGGYYYFEYIPVFPVLNGKKFIYCQYCGVSETLTKEQFKALKESTETANIS